MTAVLLRKSWLAKANKAVPTMLRDATHVKNNSLYNTRRAPASMCWAWCPMDREGRRPEGDGGANGRKAESVYEAIDRSGGYYRGHAAPESRSQMNVTFRLPDETKEKQFLAEAQSAGMVGLAGHRSVGGVRSLYNAVSPEMCQVLASFMNDFARKNG